MRLFRCDEFVGLCRAKVGTGLKVCVRSDCSIAAHAKTKMEWESLVGSLCTTAVFIAGEPVDKASTTVFASPVLAGDKAPHHEELELQTKTLVSWQAVFATLDAPGPTSGMDPDFKMKLFGDASMDQVKFGVTP